jgi:site-specific recombinase XerD
MLMTPLRRRMLDYMRLKNYSSRTIRSYICYVKEFALYLGKSPELATVEEIQAYLLHLTVERGSSQSHLSGAYSGIKVLFTGVLGRDWDLNQLPRSRREKTLPAVLSAEQAHALISTPRNLKHRTILQLIYATGLRLSEAVCLELNDIDSSRMVIIVHRGKGNKDRYVPLSATLLGALRHYWRCYRPKRYLFENANTGAHLSARTVQVVFQRAKEELGLKGKISVHTLRHCYATHLLENGVNIASLRVFLGHTNLSTTNRYLHISATHGDVPDLLAGIEAHHEAVF